MAAAKNLQSTAVFGTEFTFKTWQFDVSTGRLELGYHDAKYGEFTEVYHFPEVNAQHYQALQEPIARAFDCLHWLAGVSYYKTSLAQQLKFQRTIPSKEQAQWLTQTYQAGLAELAFESGLNWLSHIQFKGQGEGPESSPSKLNLSARSLVAIGGGKDSLVSIEAIKAMDEKASLFMVGQSAFIQSVAATTDLPLLQVSRQVDSRLQQANAAGAFNGHVPITAINAAVATTAALLADYDSVVFSNERSADVGNLTADNGQWINHQYSKSLAYEQVWQAIIQQYIAPDLHCFSLLRPFSELAIVQKFAQLDQYFAVFSSCNRNFHLAGSQNLQHHWCGACPKCAFVFLCLAPFISKAALLEIFQQDLLQQTTLYDLFESLLGIQGQKPFECVGEADECRLALQLLSVHPDWQDHPQIKHWLSRMPRLSDQQAKQIMTASEQHMIPELRNFQQVLQHVD